MEEDEIRSYQQAKNQSKTTKQSLPSPLTSTDDLSELDGPNLDGEERLILPKETSPDHSLHVRLRLRRRHDDSKMSKRREGLKREGDRSVRILDDESVDPAYPLDRDRRGSDSFVDGRRS